jgi:hypothetical protein
MNSKYLLQEQSSSLGDDKCNMTAHAHAPTTAAAASTTAAAS